MAVPESTRLRQLRKLSETLPGADQRTAQGLRAGRETQLQQQIAGAPRMAGPQAAQQLGAQQAQVTGQQALQVGEQQQQQLGQIGQIAGQQQAVEAEARLGQQQRALSGVERELANKLSDISEQAKDELLDQQLEFRTDEAGRALMNQRQLADWAAVNARSEEEFKDYAQQALQVSERKIQILKQASEKLQTALKQGQLIEGQRLSQEQLIKLREEKEALDKKLAREAADRANKAAMWGAAGTIVGAGLGAFAGGPAGAQAGAQAGGGVGTGASYL